MQLLALTFAHFLAQSLTHNFTRTHKHQRTTDALFKTNYHWRCTWKAQITMWHVRYWHVWRSHRCNIPNTEHKNIYVLYPSNNIKTKKAKQFVLHETGIEPGFVIVDDHFSQGVQHLALCTISCGSPHNYFTVTCDKFGACCCHHQPWSLKLERLRACWMAAWNFLSFYLRKLFHKFDAGQTFQAPRFSTRTS